MPIILSISCRAIASLSCCCSAPSSSESASAHCKPVSGWLKECNNSPRMFGSASTGGRDGGRDNDKGEDRDKGCAPAPALTPALILMLMAALIPTHLESTRLDLAVADSSDNPLLAPYESALEKSRHPPSAADN